MSTIIKASDIACASAARDLFDIELSKNQGLALVAQLFADHRASAVKELSTVLQDVIDAGQLKDWSSDANAAYIAALNKARTLLQ